jgi:hypothetical protein
VRKLIKEKGKIRGRIFRDASLENSDILEHASYQAYILDKRRP